MSYFRVQLKFVPRFYPMKILIRFLLLSLLGLCFWTCDLLDSGPDHLTITVPDSLKTSAGKYDSIHLDLVTIRGNDTTLRQVLFHGEYENPASLRNMPLVLSNKETFLVILKGYRKDFLWLEAHLQFVKGKAGIPRFIRDIQPGTLTAPQVKGVTPVNTKTPTWTWTVGGGGNGNFRVSLDRPDMGASVDVLGLSYKVPQDLGEGPHTLFVQERDAAGNWSVSGSATVTIDLTPPPAPKVTSTSPTLTNNPKPTWSWTAGGSGGKGHFRYRLDNPDLSTGATEGAISFTPGQNLSEAPHTVYVQEQDSAGNWSPSGSLALSIDVTPPAVPVFTTTLKSPLNSVKPTWTWNTGKAGHYRYQLDNENMNSGATEISTGSFTPASNLSEGPHTLYVQERDSAGNWSSSSSRSVVLALKGIVGRAAFSTGLANRPCLAFSNTGVLYAAYGDGEGGKGYKVVVVRLNAPGTDWESVGGAGVAPGDAAGDLSLAFSSTGVPYVAFGDGDKVTVMRLNAAGTAWEAVGGAGFSGNGAPKDISMTLNSAGVPYVAFRRSGEATVIRLNSTGTDWYGIAGAANTIVLASALSLAFNSTGTLFLTATETGLLGKTLVQRLNAAGTGWDAVGGGNISSQSYKNPAPAFSSTGIPYIALSDYGGGHSGKVMVLRLNAAGTAWEPVTGGEVSAGAADNISLAISSKGIPHVAFNDDENGGRVTVRRLNEEGTGWETIEWGGNSAGWYDPDFLAISSTGVPYVVFQNRDNGGKLTVIKASLDQ